MEAFTDSELLRLAHLRDRHRGGHGVVRQGGCSFAELHGISIQAIPGQIGLNTTNCYRCVLSRTESAGESRSCEVLFQVTADYPAPPTADEVLRWIAISAQHVEQFDVTGWALLYGFTPVGRTSVQPYHGLVRQGTNLEDFVASLVCDAANLRALLGPETFDELVRELEVS